MSETFSLPLAELHFIRSGFKLSPSTMNKTDDCELYLYHHKIIRSPEKPEPSIAPIMGRFHHRDNEIYFDRITKQMLFSFSSEKDIMRFLAKTIPPEVPDKLIPGIATQIKGFAIHEFRRLDQLSRFFGSDRDEIFYHYMPVAKEYIFDNSDIGIYFRADLLNRIPARFYDNSMPCLKIGDYKTGKIPPCTKGIKTEKKTNKIEHVTPTMTKSVENQIMFEGLFLNAFGVVGVQRSMKALYGEVIYTLDGTAIIEKITQESMEKIFKKLKEIQWKIDNEKYHFNSWSCNKMHCDYAHVCLRSLPALEILEINRMYKRDREAASLFLFNKVNEIHNRLPRIQAQNMTPNQNMEEKKEDVDD